MNIYIPKKENVERTLRNKKIVREFDGGNYKQLARKYGVSDIWIREIVKRASST